MTEKFTLGFLVGGLVGFFNVCKPLFYFLNALVMLLSTLGF